MVSLVSPRQFVSSHPVTAHGLAKLIERAVCCILLDAPDEDADDQLSDDLQSRLRERLSLPWLSPTPILLRRLAVVGEVHPAHLSLRFFQAARAMGIEVVAFGPRGHWLQDPESPREVFIELDLSVDHGLSDRIVTDI